ncbi:MAG: hypothetical protein ACYS76_12615, partial [Planctomycetota bacterium]
MSIKENKEFMNIDDKNYEVKIYEKEEKNINILKNLLDDQSYTKYYKCLAFIIGVRETIILQDLISKDNYFNGNNNDWFFNTAENIYYDTAIPIDSQKRLFDRLLKFNLIQVTYKNMPRRKFFKINYNILNKVIYKGIEVRNKVKPCSVKMTDKEPSKQQNINNNNINNNKLLSEDNKRDSKEKSLSFEKSSEITQYFIDIFYNKIKILKSK